MSKIISIGQAAKLLGVHVKPWEIGRSQVN